MPDSVAELQKFKNIWLSYGGTKQNRSVIEDKPTEPKPTSEHWRMSENSLPHSWFRGRGGDEGRDCRKKWYCGHCANGPMISNNNPCSNCGKLRDCYARKDL